MSKSSRSLNRIWLIAGFILVIVFGNIYETDTTPQAPSASNAGLSADTLFAQRRSDVQLEVSGTVSKILADDNKGSRHQRFIISLPSGLTLLVAHNIDLAPRVDQLQVGDEVSLYGEYVWNDRGGIMHWTHHDPANRHPHGWIRHQGQLYQ
ncbi:Protein of unknown function (DUF3465) [Methylophaga frappieri]|uniref:DUF3465 domain-containing protein n=1 Tax=Methylophaga frappieri (strain ATCC BAA-2434 / DSM 25690 / JAM7) TaxID=754477 RepID=I1YGN0_METFJ|nr:DUF3465 domain-containing protein [Methylophaga frappieri]AFJ02073.1 Protein of unknown function (DUF3465) [Methylophaga frappieri]